MPSIRPEVGDKIELIINIPANPMTPRPIAVSGTIESVSDGPDDVHVGVIVAATPCSLHLQYALANLFWHSVRGTWQENEEKRRYRIDENDCPGHVASPGNPKICGRCGTHVDSLRPDPAPLGERFA